jgi:hypothetical protein
MNKLKYFYGSFFITLLGLAAAYFIDPQHYFTIMYLVIILALLEISLSFDNAVVNARILETMTPAWQKIFIWIGMPIAVFGMRLIFPILLVSITTHVGFLEIFHMAIHNPEKYHQSLEHGLPLICAFGGSFLLMVFLHFFLVEDQEVKWISLIENMKIISFIRLIPFSLIIIGLLFCISISIMAQLSTGNGLIVALSFLFGMFTHQALGWLNKLVNLSNSSAGNIARNGIMGFLYLEVLDASFSFDGVIGAFAISTNIFIIMIGLGIGAMFVRSLTILFVEHKTLAKFKYLEHGAHYAIGFLALILFIKIFSDVPEWLTGTVGICLISAAFIHSNIANKLNLEIKK